MVMSRMAIVNFEVDTTNARHVKKNMIYFQESPKFSNDVFFCNDTDIGIIRQPIDGNPYKNAAVLSSGTKVS